MARTGKVYLVGAGPGDPQLITVRGLKLLQAADVVVYDRLVGPRLLKHCRDDAEKVFVGKRADRHTMRQEEISRMLVEYALRGKTVVRLKGGDPFVFGRGGEEAELLAQNGIAYEIVPGVTSAIAVPAYAGIPVTHRDFASSFAVVTGHESPDKLDERIRWEHLAHGVDTLVFVMGVARIRHIAAKLLSAGKPPETPVCLIRWGTTPEQRTLSGTLATIADAIEASGFKPPAITVIGDVATLRDKLAWFEKKPLFGKRVLITRQAEQAGELAGLIAHLGGEPLELPVIATRAPQAQAQRQKMRDALTRLSRYDWLIFTSANGVKFFFQELKAQQIDIRQMRNAKIAVVGPKTYDAVAAQGIFPDFSAEQFVAEGLFAALSPHLRRGQRVLLPRADIARNWLPEKLRESGLKVTEVDAYETVRAEVDASEAISRLKRGQIHVVTFTSSSTVRNLLRLLREQSGDDPLALLRHAEIACIGPKTAQTASECGLNVTYTAADATIQSLVEAIL
ncbi:MAG TPA: uroporphyrinogen-III C-methyltransferase [Bacilli bacterium]